MTTSPQLDPVPHPSPAAATDGRPALLSPGAVRVGVVGPDSLDMFAENIADCLPDLGVHPVLLGPAIPMPGPARLQRPVSAARAAFGQIDASHQRRLVARAEHEGVELVVSVQTLLPVTVAELRRRGIRVCLWFPDHVANLGRQQMLLGDYDALFFKDQLLTRRLADVLNLPAHYLPEACNPARHRPPSDAGFQPHVVFVGHMYPARVRLVRELVEHGVQVRISGPPVPGWVNEPLLTTRHTGKFVRAQEKATVFREALAVVNALHPAEMHGVNCRLFEAAACGGTVLCERRPSLPDFFDEDTEVLAFTTFDEMLAKIKWCVDDREAARAVGDAASERGRREHTYQDRLSRLLGVVL